MQLHNARLSNFTEFSKREAQTVQMETYASLILFMIVIYLDAVRGELRFATTTGGAQCVMMAGTPLVQKLPANN